MAACCCVMKQICHFWLWSLFFLKSRHCHNPTHHSPRATRSNDETLVCLGAAVSAAACVSCPICSCHLWPPAVYFHHRFTWWEPFSAWTFLKWRQQNHFRLNFQDTLNTDEHFHILFSTRGSCWALYRLVLHLQLLMSPPTGRKGSGCFKFNNSATCWQWVLQLMVCRYFCCLKSTMLTPRLHHFEKISNFDYYLFWYCDVICDAGENDSFYVFISFSSKNILQWFGVVFAGICAKQSCFFWVCRMWRCPGRLCITAIFELNCILIHSLINCAAPAESTSQ